MPSPQQEELQIIDNLISNAIFALQRATNSGKDDQERHYLQAIATSLTAIAKLLQLQAENS